MRKRVVATLHKLYFPWAYLAYYNLYELFQLDNWETHKKFVILTFTIWILFMK